MLESGQGVDGNEEREGGRRGSRCIMHKDNASCHSKLFLAEYFCKCFLIIKTSKTF